ncbi:MAG: GNAT family N-acetyltransferase [Oscillospiraceae bacterium]|nr:GNAT family N-acetyltransferase [Oscillospiraceae bacterium]
MELKTFTMSDYNEVYALWRSTKGICSCEKCLSLDTEEKVAKFLERNPDTCFTAVSEGELVGAILSGHDGRNGFIYHLAVAEKVQKQGIGKALVEKAKAALKREGINNIMLFALKENKGGNIFWEKSGFEEMDNAYARKLNV